MPSDQSTWLISVPQGHDPHSLFQRLADKLTTQAKLPPRNVGQLVIPSFKVSAMVYFDEIFV
jgi:V-type H+-transporting ATPase subunit C